MGPIELSSKTGLKSVVVKYRLDFDNYEYVINSLKCSHFQIIHYNFFPIFCTHISHNISSIMAFGTNQYT